MGDVVRIRGVEEDVVSVGGPVDEARPTLCVHGDDLELEEVTRLLGCSPSRSHRKGEVLGSRGIRAHTGAWLLETAGTSSGELEAQILELLAKVTTDGEAWRQLAQRYTVQMREVGDDASSVYLPPSGYPGCNVPDCPRIAHMLVHLFSMDQRAQRRSADSEAVVQDIVTTTATVAIEEVEGGRLPTPL